MNYFITKLDNKYLENKCRSYSKHIFVFIKAEFSVYLLVDYLISSPNL